MRYILRIDREQEPNTFDTLIVCCTNDKEKFDRCWKNIISGLMEAETIQKCYWRNEENFTYLILEIKL